MEGFVVNAFVGLLLGLQVTSCKEPDNRKYFHALTSAVSFTVGTFGSDETIVALLPMLSAFYAVGTARYVMSKSYTFVLHNALVISMLFWPYFSWGVPLISHFALFDLCTIFVSLRRAVQEYMGKIGDRIFHLCFAVLCFMTPFVRVKRTTDSTDDFIIVFVMFGFTVFNIVGLIMLLKRRR